MCTPDLSREERRKVGRWSDGHDAATTDLDRLEEHANGLLRALRPSALLHVSAKSFAILMASRIRLSSIHHAEIFFSQGR